MTETSTASQPLARQFRPGRALLIYAVAVIGLGTLGAPGLFWFVQWLAGACAPCAWLGKYPFRRVFDRAFLIVALAGLWPLVRNLGCRSVAEFGYPRRPAAGWQVLLGFGLGLVSLLVLDWVTRGGGWQALPAAQWLKLLFTAVVVALIEEALFRGGIQGAFQRSLHPLPALLLASLIYSALHFLKPGGVRIAAEDVHWWSGLQCLAAILTRSYSATGAAVAFVTLFLVGGVLGLAFQRTQALYWSMGLHAGWVLANEYVREVARTAVVEDWRAWPVVIAVGGIVWYLTRRRPETDRSP